MSGSYTEAGIKVTSSSNRIYHNDLINNTKYAQAYDNTGNNSWYSSYPFGGNYWNDYTGVDLKSGSNQNIPGSDGIGDAPYNIAGGANAKDRYPFMRVNGWRSRLPVADCGADKLRCENVGAPVQFNGSASNDPDGAVISYYWEFGDGTNGTGTAPKHTYSKYRWNGSTYLPLIVNLTVTDNSGLTNSTSQKVIIWIAGDANGDGIVNIIDAALIGLNWGSAEPCPDLNNDGKVNIIDAAIIGLNWGRVAVI